MDDHQQLPHANNHHHLALIVSVLVGGLTGLWVASIYNTNIPAAVLVGVLIGFVFVADLARRARDI
jgi:F0F1-type ATP synthase assembly protein I